MLKLRGRAEEVRGFDAGKSSVVLRLRLANARPIEQADTAIIRNSLDINEALAQGFSSFVFLGGHESDFNRDELSFVSLPQNYDYLDDGDIVGISPTSGSFRSLYRRKSEHNSFFVTERCDNYCLMCSQPPRDVNDEWLFDEISAALPLVDQSTKAFSFTGGEPLLNWRRFICILHECRKHLPNTSVHVLSNGRAFADNTVAKAWADVQHPQLSAGIPVYSAVDHLHDYIVQAKGAYDETVLGILNLKNLGQRVEVRVVLHALSAPRIFETCRWLSRNLPFVDHVALMGMENTGFALANEAVLAIDPLDYVGELERGVECLITAGMRASVYNLPRCILPRSLWPYSVQSISDWKRGFVAECDSCFERQNCSGFFETGRLKRSRGIVPFINSRGSI